MPKVERLPSGSYRIRYIDPWGRRAVVTQPTAADVRAAYKNIVSAMARGEYVDPKAGRVTVGEWAEQWLEGARNVGPGGRDIYRQALDRIVPELGKVPLGKLSAEDIDRYISLRLETHAASTVHRDYRTLHRMLAVAVERRLIAANPARHVQPPKVPRREVPVLTVDQVDQLADAITSRYRALIYVAAYGGLRWSELVGLRRRNVDGATIRVVEQLVLRRATPPDEPGVSKVGAQPPTRALGCGPGSTPPKGGGLPGHPTAWWDRCEPKVGSRRTVTLPSFVAASLKEHVETFSNPGDDGLVFPTRNGTPIQGPSWTGNTFRRALAKAKLPHIRVHDLRHTSVSLALAAGGRLEVVQERHGHSSIRVTADVYGHRYDGADAAVAAALDDMHARAQRARLRAV